MDIRKYTPNSFGGFNYFCFYFLVDHTTAGISCHGSVFIWAKTG